MSESARRSRHTLHTNSPARRTERTFLSGRADFRSRYHGSQCHHNPTPLVTSSRNTTSVLSENLGMIRRRRMATSRHARESVKTGDRACYRMILRGGGEVKASVAGALLGGVVPEFVEAEEPRALGQISGCPPRVVLRVDIRPVI